MRVFSDTLRLIRFPLCFTAVSNSAAGHFLTSDSVDLLRLGAVTGISLLVYSLGMVLNDIADRERDRGLHPDRPLVRGTLSVGYAWTLIGFFLGGALGLSFSAGGGTPLMTAILVALVVSYDVLLKRLGLVGAAAMGAARAGNFLLGAACFQPTGGFPWHPYASILFVYVFAVTGISLLEESPRRSLCAAWILVSLGCFAAVAWMGEGGASVLLAAGAGFAVMGTRAIPTLRDFGRARIMQTVVTGILMIILLDAAAVLSRPDRLIHGIALLILLPLAWAARRILSAPAS